MKAVLSLQRLFPGQSTQSTWSGERHNALRGTIAHELNSPFPLIGTGGTSDRVFGTW
ncbi:hypothetical protein [Stakelama flava]|uniref:hypothetical protein n=1 Tax=Stakelama flava TaxID=2860338 RepID=UPI001C5A70F6|nr:hypothetical protein [Stakelama flava]